MRKKSFDGTSRLISEIISDAKAEAAARIDANFEWVSGFCESPIERLFAAQLLHPELASEFDTRIEFARPPSGQVAKAVPPPFPGIYIFPQITIGNYRVDFLVAEVSVGPSARLIVELDGHDFHERTKDQAQRDKARDRFLVSQGYRVLRFTGSEVFRDPRAVAHEVIAVLLEIM